MTQENKVKTYKKSAIALQNSGKYHGNIVSFVPVGMKLSDRLAVVYPNGSKGDNWTFIVGKGTTAMNEAAGTMPTEEQSIAAVWAILSILDIVKEG